MADVKTALVALLAGDGGVSAIVGTRVRIDTAWAKDELPYIVMHDIGGAVGYHMGGEDGLDDIRIQIESWASTRGGAEALKRAVRSVVSGYRGTAGPSGAQTFISNIIVDNGPDAREIYPAGSDDWRYGALIDAIVWHQA
jgi:hypothetical protein